MPPFLQLEVPALWTVIVGSFLLMGLWEGFRPHQTLLLSTERRWSAHLALLLIGGLTQAALFRVSPLLVALAAADHPWGLLNRPAIPAPLQFAAALLLLDLVRYLTHRLFHRFAFLWRIHEVHHSDPDYDISTSARFHPLEIIGAKALYLAAIVALAPPLAAVFVSELLTALLNAFVHGNVALPTAAERLLRLVFITPDLHRLHHSQHPAHHSRNFGQTFVLWDRLFGTYLPGQPAIVPGVAGAPVTANVLSLLAEPFRRRPQ